MEDGLRGLGVGPDVELGGRGHVAVGDRAAHEDDALHVGAARALEEQGDVGQRPRRHERDRLRARGDRPLHEVDGVLTERRPARRGQRRAVETAFAVDVGRDGELPDEGPIGARRDGNIGAAGEVEHPKGVRRRLLERLVPVHDGHAEHVELGACEREEQRDRVVVPRIAVEDDRDSR